MRENFRFARRGAEGAGRKNPGTTQKKKRLQCTLKAFLKFYQFILLNSVSVVPCIIQVQGNVMCASCDLNIITTTI